MIQSKKKNRISISYTKKKQKGGTNPVTNNHVLDYQISMFNTSHIELSTPEGKRISNEIFVKIEREAKDNEKMAISKVLPSGLLDSFRGKIESDTYEKIITDRLKIFDKPEDAKEILMAMTHSSLPAPETPYIPVPNNVCVCFTVPILHFGVHNTLNLFDNEYDTPEEEKKIFEDIFKCKQKMDELPLAYKKFKEWDLYGYNYFQHSSWYYPGQSIPNVLLTCNIGEYQSGKMKIYSVKFNSAGTKENTLDPHFIDNFEVLGKTKFMNNLSFYLDKLASNSFKKYIIIITGCRNIGKVTPNINYYEEMKKKEVFLANYNSTLIPECSITASTVIKNRYISPQKIFSRSKNVIENILYADFLELLINTNYKNSHQINRLNKIYERIFKKIIDENSITPEEYNYLFHASENKFLQIILKLKKMGKFDSISHLLAQYPKNALGQRLVESIKTFLFNLQLNIDLGRISIIPENKNKYFGQIMQRLLLFQDHLDIFEMSALNFDLSILYLDKSNYDQLQTHKPEIITNLKALYILDVFYQLDEFQNLINLTLEYQQGEFIDVNKHILQSYNLITVEYMSIKGCNLFDVKDTKFLENYLVYLKNIKNLEISNSYLYKDSGSSNLLTLDLNYFQRCEMLYLDNIKTDYHTIILNSQYLESLIIESTHNLQLTLKLPNLKSLSLNIPSLENFIFPDYNFIEELEIRTPSPNYLEFLSTIMRKCAIFTGDYYEGIIGKINSFLSGIKEVNFYLTQITELNLLDFIQNLQSFHNKRVTFTFMEGKITFPGVIPGNIIVIIKLGNYNFKFKNCDTGDLEDKLNSGAGLRIQKNFHF